jgi:hypothetical protein
MVHKQPGQCPVCGGDMIIKELECPTCEVTVRGSFDTCPFCILTGEQLELIKIFLKSRGNIKEVERELGISYPTVRGRLDDVVRALGFTPSKPEVTRGMKEELLAKLESGEINADEFVRKLDETSA